MAVLQKGNALYPFWGEQVSIITGLDPLGLQLTSEATYATLLPGISNLTNRIRYYGFYCWLLDFYFKTEKKGNSTEQYKFIRRAELMMALIMQSERSNVQQVTGSDFASNLIETVTAESYNLAKGADKDKGQTDVYWKYPSGAFGQYYYGAMRALSLVTLASNEEKDFIYNVTEPNPRQKKSGKQLAEAFDLTLTPEIKKLFHQNIKDGKLYKKDIPSLAEYFFIDKINAENQEWQAYNEMLLDKDAPSEEVEENFTFHRQETIEALIKSAKANNDEFDWQLFLLECYENKFSNEQTLSGWYCYQLNEYWQFACGTVFWGILEHLYSFQQDQYLPAFIKNFSDELIKSIEEKYKKGLTGSSKVSAVFAAIEKGNEEENFVAEIKKSVKNEEGKLAAMDGFMLLFQLYQNNKEYLVRLKEYMEIKQTIRNGNMADGLMEIEKMTDFTLLDFIEQFLLKKIIYRHQMVAIRKMGNGVQSTHKFFIEDQYIRFIESYPPRNTSPRMNALWNLLYDMQIIDDENMLTSLHTRTISK